MQKEPHQAKQQIFMEMYDPLHDRLCRFVQTLVWNREDAKDIVSETVLTAYEQLEKLKKPESFLYYLFSVASRIVKKKNMRGRFWGIFNSHQSESIAGNENRESGILLSELRTALAKIPASQSEAITLFEVSGLSIKEIAIIQDSSEGSVKTRISRARDTLAILLEKNGPARRTTFNHSAKTIMQTIKL